MLPCRGQEAGRTPTVPSLGGYQVFLPQQDWLKQRLNFSQISLAVPIETITLTKRRLRTAGWCACTFQLIRWAMGRAGRQCGVCPGSLPPSVGGSWNPHDGLFSLTEEASECVSEVSSEANYLGRITQPATENRASYH